MRPYVPVRSLFLPWFSGYEAGLGYLTIEVLISFICYGYADIIFRFCFCSDIGNCFFDKEAFVCTRIENEIQSFCSEQILSVGYSLLV